MLYIFRLYMCTSCANFKQAVKQFRSDTKLCFSISMQMVNTPGSYLVSLDCETSLFMLARVGLRLHRVAQNNIQLS